MIEGRCAACKYLRRKCVQDCIFSPYFPSKDPQRFAYVHKIYGASNVAKLLQGLPENARATAVDTMHYEAKLRVEDPVYGVVGPISILQQQIIAAENELAELTLYLNLIKSNLN